MFIQSNPLFNSPSSPVVLAAAAAAADVAPLSIPAAATGSVSTGSVSVIDAATYRDRLYCQYSFLNPEELNLFSDLLKFPINQELGKIIDPILTIPTITSIVKELCYFRKFSEGFIRLPKNENRPNTLSLRRNYEEIHIGLYVNTLNKTVGILGKGTYKVVKEGVRIIVKCPLPTEADPLPPLTFLSVDKAAIFRFKKQSSAEKTLRYTKEFAILQPILRFLRQQVSCPELLNIPSSYIIYASNKADAKGEKYIRFEGIEDRFFGDLYTLGLVGVCRKSNGVRRRLSPVKRLKSVVSGVKVAGELHKIGYKHGDFKPSNILLEKRIKCIVAKLGDWDFLDIINFSGGYKRSYSYWDYAGLDGKYTPNTDIYGAAFSALELMVPYIEDLFLVDGVPLPHHSQEYIFILKHVILFKLRNPETTHPIGDKIIPEVCSRISHLNDFREIVEATTDVFFELIQNQNESHYHAGLRELNAQIIAASSTFRLYLEELERAHYLNEYLDREEESLRTFDCLVNQIRSSNLPLALQLVREKWAEINSVLMLTKAEDLISELENIIEVMELAKDPNTYKEE